MRRPRMSTGAWIFAGLVAAAVIAPTVVYAATISRVAIGNTNNAVSASVTQSHQLLTTPIPSSSVINRFIQVPGHSCTTAYTPPAGKAIVITSLTYDLGSGTPGTEAYAELAKTGCTAIYDIGDTVQAFETEQRNWPTGLPIPSVAIQNPASSAAFVFFTGYLIPSTSLPPSAALGGPANFKPLANLRGTTPR